MIAIYRAFMRLIAYFLGHRWIRFAITGGMATVTYFLLGLLFVNELNWPVLLGNAMAYALSFVVSYLGQCLWTFEAHGSHLRMLPRFAATQLIGLCINSVIIEICRNLGIPYMISMLVAIVIVPIFVYLLCKFWVFKPAADAGNG